MAIWYGTVVRSLTPTRGLVLSAVVLALLLLAQPAHAVTFSAFDSSTSQVIGSSSPIEVGRPLRGGTASTCGAPNVPSTFESTAHHYNSHTHTSDLNNSVCVQVALSTACEGTNYIFAQTYDTSFDPANINTNYIGDLGASPPTGTSYSFTVGAGHTFIDVVNEVTANAGCPSYDISWGSNLPWNSVSPILSVAPTVGQALTTSNGTWNTSPSIAYQWRRCSASGTPCNDIAGTTSSSYTPTSADLGQTLRARVFAINAEGTSSTDTAASAVVAVSPPTITVPPPTTTTPPTTTPPTPPLVTGASQSATKWRVGNALAKLSRNKKPPIGTTFSFNLNQAATVRFTFTALSVGRRVGKKCIRPTKSKIHTRSCKRRLAAGVLSLHGHQGTDKVRFQGRISPSTKLKPGRYSMAITATNTAGQRSSAQTLSFTIVK
jgi:hypothetical protein